MLTSMTKNTGTVVNRSLQAYLQTNQQRPIIGMPHHTTQLPRQVTVATFRQDTGHDKLQAHLHKTDGNKHQCPVGNNGRNICKASLQVWSPMHARQCTKPWIGSQYLIHCTAHGTAAKSRHWLDDKKTEIDTIIKMLPHHLSEVALVLLSLSINLKHQLFVVLPPCKATDIT